MTLPIEPIRASKVAPVLPEVSTESASLVSQVVERTLANINAASPAQRTRQVKAKGRKLDKTLDKEVAFLEQLSLSKKPLSDMVIEVLLKTDFVEQMKQSKGRQKEKVSLFQSLLKASKDILTKSKQTQKTVSGLSSAEVLFSGQKGALSTIYSDVKKVTGPVELVRESLALLSLSSTVVSFACRAFILSSVEDKRRALQKELDGLSKEASPLKDQLQGEIEKLTLFYQEGKKEFIKEVKTGVYTAGKQLLDCAQFSFDLLAEVSKVVPVKATAAAASNIVGLVSYGLGVIEGGYECFKCGREVSRYTVWLDRLQNRLKRVEIPLARIPSETTAAAFKAVSDLAYQKYTNDVRVQTPDPNPEKRSKALADLKKEMKKFIRGELTTNGVAFVEGQVDLLVHVQMRRLFHEMRVRECGSEEKACKSEALSISIKNGLTNLAIEKHRVEKALYAGHASFTFSAVKLALAITGFVTALLLAVSVLCPPVGPFILFGVLVGGAILFSATLIHQYVTKPSVFKATYGSLEGWLGWIHQLRAKFYDVRLDGAKTKLLKLEQKLAPVCFKIAILERLRQKEVPHREEIVALLGVHCAAGRSEAVKAIDEHIVRLKASLGKKDVQEYEKLKRHVEELSSRVEKAHKPIDAFEKKLKAAYEEERMRVASKNENWQELEKLLTKFKDGIVANLLDNETLCGDIMEEVREVTGIQFDLAKMHEAVEQVRTAPTEQALRKASIQLYASIGEPIQSFLARQEGKLGTLPMFKK